MRIKRLLALACLSGLPLQAQQEEDPRTRPIQFKVYAENDASAALNRDQNASGKIPRLRYSFYDGEKLVAVDEAAEGFHGSYQGVVVDGILRFYRPGLTALEGAAPDAVLAEIPVPDDWKRLLLYAYTTGSGGTRFLPLSKRSDLQDGRSLCLNLTGRPIAVEMGETRFLLDVNGLDQFSLNQAGESGRIAIKVAAEWQQNWRLALSSSRNLRTDESYLFLFKAGDTGSRISLRIIDLPEMD